MLSDGELVLNFDQDLQDHLKAEQFFQIELFIFE